MPTHVLKNPATLRWSNFITRPERIADGTELMDAFTRFHAVMPSGFIPKAMAGGLGLVFPDRWNITITPKAQVWKGANKTAELLAHEQLHYFFGFVTARAMVNDFLALRVKQKGEFKKAMFDLYDLHMEKRAQALNEQYDDETGHGVNTSKQQLWQVAMDACLANDAATTLMGLDL